MNILMVSVTFPYPPARGGTEVRTFHLLKALQQEHSVTLMTLAYPGVPAADIETLKTQVSHLQVFPVPTPRQHHGVLAKALRFTQFLLDGTPTGTRDRQTAAIQDWIDSQAASGQFGALTCEHSANEVFISPTVQAHIPTRIVNIHSSVYGTCQQQLAQGTTSHPWRDRLHLGLLKRYEARYCKKFTDLVVTTPEDAHQMRDLCPSRPIHVISNGVDLQEFPLRPKDPGGYDLVFVGAMDTPANVDAAIYFSQEVFPRVRDRYPQATLYLVGTRPTPPVLALREQPGIVVTGRVPSTTPYLHRACVCVVPLRSGYGIKNKTLEAMAAGVPVVASDRGLESLDICEQSAPRAFRANTPTAYVEAIDRLFGNPELRQTLSRNGRTMIETDFTWDKAGHAYCQVVRP